MGWIFCPSQCMHCHLITNIGTYNINSSSPTVRISCNSYSSLWNLTSVQFYTSHCSQIWQNCTKIERIVHDIFTIWITNTLLANLSNSMLSQRPSYNSLHILWHDMSFWMTFSLKQLQCYKEAWVKSLVQAVLGMPNRFITLSVGSMVNIVSQGRTFIS